MMSAHAPAVSLPELEATVGHVADQLSEPDGPRTVVVWARPDWVGPDTLTVDGLTLKVAACPTALAVRQTLVESSGIPTVILTPIRELGTDVEARIATNRIRTPDQWQALKRAFAATELDPRIYKARWIAEELLAARPPGGYPPVHGGTLTREHALTALASQHLGIADLAPDPVSFLEWARTSDSRRRLLDTPGRVRDELIDVVTESIPFAPAVVAAVINDQPTDVLALGLVCDAVFSESATSAVPQAAAAAARLEQLIGGRRLESDQGRAWAHASAELLTRLAEQPEAIQAALAIAETLIADLDAAELAIHSDHLRTGFTHRVSALADRITAALNGAPAQKVWQAVDDLARHRLSAVESRRVDRARMAARLVSWLADQSPSEAGLTGIIGRYRDDGAWADLARRQLLYPDDDDRLTAAFRELRDRIDQRRAATADALAHALAATGGEPPEQVLGIESLLDTVVAPLAEQSPIQLIVLDGMGWDIWHELLADIAKRDWVPIAPSTKPPSDHSSDGFEELAVVAALPTVTEASRCSLLVGALKVGDQNTERDAFASHPALSAIASKSHPPRLLHRSQLTAGEGRGLADEAGEVVGDPANRVVAAVINAADDHLHHAGQLLFDWTVETIQPLAGLLGRAEYAGRIVIVTADHGHILDAGTDAAVFTGDGGERWRAEGGPPREGEVEITGRRVLRGGGRIVVPWDDTIRYSSARGDGYHGGVNPQEVLVPIEVLVPAQRATDLPAGWKVRHRRSPSWWNERDIVATSEPATPPGPKPKKRRGTQEPTLPGLETTERTWVEKLLASQILRAQRERIGGRPIPDGLLSPLLSGLDRTGGRLTKAEIADATGLPLARVQGFVATVARLLNVEGYPVIVDDGDSVALDRSLAVTQFGLEP